jgi:hypothetical protein
MGKRVVREAPVAPRAIAGLHDDAASRRHECVMLIRRAVRIKRRVRGL